MLPPLVMQLILSSLEINYRKGKLMILRGRKRVAHWLLGDNFDSCCHGHLIESRFDIKAEWLLKKAKQCNVINYGKEEQLH